MHWRRKWQPTPVFLPGESQGRGSLWAAVYGVAQSRTRLKRRSSGTQTCHTDPPVSPIRVDKSESENRSVMSDSLQTHGLYNPWNFPGQNTRVSSCSLLQGIFPTQGLNPGLLHCRWILYQLSQQASPRILECVAYLFSRGSSQPRNQTGVSEWIRASLWFIQSIPSVPGDLIFTML